MGTPWTKQRGSLSPWTVLPVQLMAELRATAPYSHESALIAQKQVGNPRVAWFQYQPLWDLIVSEQPDLLD